MSLLASFDHQIIGSLANSASSSVPSKQIIKLPVFDTGGSANVPFQTGGIVCMNPFNIVSVFQSDATESFFVPPEVA